MIWLQLFPFVVGYLAIGVALCRLAKKLEFDEEYFGAVLLFWPAILAALTFSCVFGLLLWGVDALGRLAGGK